MKNILLTGVSSGLGLDTLKSLLSEGYTVYGISRRLTTDLVQLQAQYTNSFIHLQYDLSDSNSISLLHMYILQNKLILHSFINNAATAYDDLVTNAKLDELERMLQVNTIAPILITKLVIRNFLLHKTAGTIVHISSISVHTGYKGLSMYAASKGAIEAFSKNVAREWGEVGIRSNCVVSGFMSTEMSNTLSSDQKNKIYNRTALKRETRVSSVVDTIKFLISDGAKSITGQNIHVDSGTI